MAEFIGGKNNLGSIEDPIVFENNTDFDFEVSVGIVFRKSGIYAVSIDGKRISVSKVLGGNHDQPPAQPEPKTVIYSGDGYASGNMVYDLAECPECGYEYEEDDMVWGEPYCPHCGQLLSWDVEGE